MSGFQAPSCAYCARKTPMLTPCSKCSLAFYCSKPCQEKDLQRHGEWCQIMQGGLGTRDSIPPISPESAPPSSQGKKKKKKKKRKKASSQEDPLSEWRERLCEDTSKTVLSGQVDTQLHKSDEAQVTRESGTGHEYLKKSPCVWCQKIPDSALRCSGCRKATYCSSKCQKKDWQDQHKEQCDRSYSQAKSSTQKTTSYNGSTIKGPHKSSISKRCAWCQKLVDEPLKCLSCTNTFYCSYECRTKDIAEHEDECRRDSEANTPETQAAEAEEEDSSKQGCNMCNKVVKDLKKCGRCKMAAYCSKVCQKKDWSRHKEECIAIDGVIETKEYQKKKKEDAEAAAAAARARQGQGRPMTQLEHMMHLLGYLPESVPNNDVPPKIPWSAAKRIVQMKYPGAEIVESFQEMPAEMFIYVPAPENQVLLAHITRFHHYQRRHSIYIRDVDGDETAVMFYLDGDNPYPYFSWAQVQPGNYICLENAYFHHFMDGTVGIRVNTASHVKII